MTAIAVTAAQVGLVDPLKSDVRSYIAASAITKGQAVYFNTAGKAAPANAGAAGTSQFRGIALNAAAAGAAVDVVHDGLVYGFGVSALNGDAIVYLSNSAGVLNTATAATVEVHCGRVVVLPDGSLTKVLRVFTQWEADWA